MFDHFFLSAFPSTALLTGPPKTLEDMYTVPGKIYALIRAFWVREFGNKWNRKMDMTPARCFAEPLTKGAFKGTKLDQIGYENMLELYYKNRG